MTPEQRSAVVAEALSWSGTPYHNGAAIKGVGADCARFPLAVYVAVGLLPETKVERYAADWHLHRGEEIYLEWVERLGAQEIKPDDRQAGDFVIWRWGRTFSHGGVLLSPGTVMHASLENEIVAADEIDVHEQLRTRLRRFFTLGD